MIAYIIVSLIIAVVGYVGATCVCISGNASKHEDLIRENKMLRVRLDQCSETYYCHDCDAEIIGGDDDAMVCIECGGLNRRV